MEDFEKQLIDVAQRCILKRIGEGGWLQISGRAIEVNRDTLLRIFGKIDMERVEKLVLSRIEERIADKIFNALATELAHDTKSLMCDATARAIFRNAIKERIGTLGG